MLFITIALIVCYIVTLVVFSVSGGIIIYAIISFIIGVPALRSSHDDVVSLLRRIPVTEKDTVVDLGCGTGHTLFLFEKMTPARTIGYELNIVPLLYAKASAFLRRKKTAFSLNDFMQADLSQATVIYTYLGPAIMKTLKEPFEKKLAKGTRLISYTFPLPGREPDETYTCKKHSFYLYTY